MDRDFLLLNGDTVFDTALLTRVLNSEPAPITLCVDYKSVYDTDDMKVQLDEKGWVKHVSKTLSVNQIDAESIGLIFFRERGPQLFRDAVEDALRHQAALKFWYLSIIDAWPINKWSMLVPCPGMFGVKLILPWIWQGPKSFSAEKWDEILQSHLHQLNYYGRMSPQALPSYMGVTCSREKNNSRALGFLRVYYDSALMLFAG